MLRHASDKSRPAVQIFNEEWRSESPDLLMRHIENAVYEHPSVLDDYATEIVVEAPELTWVPSGIFDGDGISEEVAEEIFRSVYPEGSCGVMAGVRRFYGPHHSRSENAQPSGGAGRAFAPHGCR